MKIARVVKVRAAGVIVQLEDNEEAWLPGRELSTQYNPFISLNKQDYGKMVRLRRFDIWKR